MERWQKISIAVLSLLVVAAGAFSVGYTQARRAFDPASAPTIEADEKGAALRIIRDAYEEIRNEAVRQPDEDELARGAVRGMIKVLKE